MRHITHLAATRCRRLSSYTKTMSGNSSRRALPVTYSYDEYGSYQTGALSRSGTSPLVMRYKCASASVGMYSKYARHPNALQNREWSA